MKKLIAVLALTMLAGCDSGGGSSGGSGNLDCIAIAGDYKVPMVETTTGYRENIGITIQANCAFAAVSQSTGTSTGKLTPVGNETYTGRGKNSGCPNGKFSIRVTGTSSSGISFWAQCD